MTVSNTLPKATRQHIELLWGSGLVITPHASIYPYKTTALAQPSSALATLPRTVINLTGPALCSVCYNLDLYQVPDDALSGYSWAAKEYQIPEDMPVGVITVQAAQRLVESAASGCIYCTVVAYALETIFPGWEKQHTFVEILLAAGLPMIVRLNWGVTATVSMEAWMRENNLIPEGTDRRVIATVIDPNLTPLEIQVYRPVIPDQNMTVKDAIIAYSIQAVGVAEEVASHSADPECFEFIRKNDGLQPLLPDRIIWVQAKVSSRIALLEPDRGTRASYITLSYCWGQVTAATYLTQAETLSERKAGIEFEDLPPLFQDVVTIARALGIDYIWIDRLCIIQGDDADFSVQASKMGDIYGNATMTIAAAAANTEMDRILLPRDNKWLSSAMSLDFGGGPSTLVRFRRASPALGTESSGGEYGRMSTRAWVWQERLLSSRTVFFTPGRIKFECHFHSCWEGFGSKQISPSWTAVLDDMSYQKWTTLVKEYTSRGITRPSDRLPAMDSVMKRIEANTGCRSVYGLWSNSLVEGLIWRPIQRFGQAGIHHCQMNPGHYAPTWSWASVDGPVSYALQEPLPLIEDNGPSHNGPGSDDPMECDLKLQSVNKASGMIRVSGRLLLVRLQCDVKRNWRFRPGRVQGERREYFYSIQRPNNRYTFSVEPDVSLKPCNISVDEESKWTVVRVPYGEIPPKRSWATECACLLVGKRKTRAIFLLLGHSIRQPGAWERVGISDGLRPSAFRDSPRQVIGIV
ncbi:heterokaryon incompatibility protein-domain-containing protein [Aspergillus ambiguus]|uniref:heterokaryon incompatibility protein-domain-containing protein n=1 Tax=Aspergillus ambiguus TaxID=176160 RepID=UPI003CCCF878